MAVVIVMAVMVVVAMVMMTMMAIVVMAATMTVHFHRIGENSLIANLGSVKPKRSLMYFPSRVGGTNAAAPRAMAGRGKWKA